MTGALSKFRLLSEENSKTEPHQILNAKALLVQWFKNMDDTFKCTNLMFNKNNRVTEKLMEITFYLCSES